MMPASPQSAALSAPAGEAPAETNIVHVVQRLLRGRWAFTLTVVPMCAVLGAALGFMQGAQEYKSTGVIQIRPTLDKRIYDTEQNDLPPMFTSFVRTQARLLTTERVTQRALEDEVLRRALGETPMTAAELSRRLDVSTDPGTQELIFVSLTDASPGLANAAVGAVIRAYTAIYSNAGSLNRPEIVTPLEDLRRRRQADMRTLEAQLRQEVAPWSTNDLDPLREIELQKVLDNRTAAAAARAEVSAIDAELERLAAGPLEGIDPHAAPIDDLIYALAPLDEQVAAAAERRREMLDEEGRLLAAGITDEHRQLVTVRQMLRRDEEEIRRRAADGRSGVTDRRRAELGRLREEATKVAEQADAAAAEAAAEARRIGDAILVVEDLRQDIARHEQELLLVERRLEAIRFESSGDNVGRIQVLSEASVPALPTEDSRRKKAAMGLVAGGGLPFAAVLALGLLDRRVRYASDVEAQPDHGPRLLAVIPRLDPTRPALPQPEVARIIHGLRGRLQLTLGPGHHTIAFASAIAGEGKTTVAASLAVSLAESGARVIAADFDFIGRGLSAQLGAVPPVSLVDAVADNDPDRALVGTNVPGVRAVAATDDDEARLGRLSPAAVRAFLDSLRKRADFVVIDTGPLLGSVEAVLACSAADGTVLVVGRGTSRGLVEAARRELGSLHARTLGLVFNGASAADAVRSSSTSSRRLSAPANGRHPDSVGRLNPVASVLADPSASE